MAKKIYYKNSDEHINYPDGMIIDTNNYFYSIIILIIIIGGLLIIFL